MVDPTVQEAARRLHCSASTIRRRCRAGGDLQSADGPGPLRVVGASVDLAQRQMLHSMGLSAHLVDDHDTPAHSTDPTVEQLRAQVQLLQGALSDLTAAHSALLDTFRRISSGAVPNH